MTHRLWVNEESYGLLAEKIHSVRCARLPEAEHVDLQVVLKSILRFEGPVRTLMLDDVPDCAGNSWSYIVRERATWRARRISVTSALQRAVSTRRLVSQCGRQLRRKSPQGKRTAFRRLHAPGYHIMSEHELELLDLVEHLQLRDPER